MTDKHQEEPKLLFFRETPEDLLTRPPLASSLQHLETSFLLIALKRYPHALVSCTSAIESALKAAFNTTREPSLRKLLHQAIKLFPPDADFEKSEINDFLEKRNEIIHYGFSPKDDEISAILLLKTGYRLIEQCYQTFFHFHLKRSSERYGGLFHDVDNQLDISRKVYLKAKDEPGLNLTYCFIAFAHQINWSIRHWMLSDWQKDLLDSEAKSGCEGWDFKHKHKEELEYKIFNASWEFDCPICNSPESFICELDVDELEKGRIRLKRGVCVNCSLKIFMDCPFLSDELCGDQFDEVRPKILKEYGIR